MRKAINILIIIILYALAVYLMNQLQEQGSITYIALVVAFLGQIVSILLQRKEGTNFNTSILKLKMKNFIKNTEKYKSSLEYYLEPIKKNKSKIDSEYIENIRKSIYTKIYNLFDKNFKSYYEINNPIKDKEKKIEGLLEIQDIFIDYEHVVNNIPYSNINTENVLSKYNGEEILLKDDVFYINQILEKANKIK